MLPFKLVYHDRYDLRLFAHVFPSQKFRLVRDALVAKGEADPADILAPEPASDEDVLRVHTPEYVDKLKNGTLTAMERMRMELPYSTYLFSVVAGEFSRHSEVVGGVDVRRIVQKGREGEGANAFGNTGDILRFLA